MSGFNIALQVHLPAGVPQEEAVLQTCMLADRLMVPLRISWPINKGEAGLTVRPGDDIHEVLCTLQQLTRVVQRG